MPHQQASFLKFSRRAFLLAVMIFIMGAAFVAYVIFPIVETGLVRGVLLGAVVIISLLVYLVLAGQAQLHTLLMSQQTLATDSPGVAVAVNEPTDSTRLHNIFESSQSAMAFLDLDGRFLQVNPTFCQLLGYDAGSLIARPSQTIIQSDDRAAYEQALADLLVGKISNTSLEQYFCHHDGIPVWIKIGILLLRDAQDQPDCFVIQVDDRSQEKVMEDALWQQILRNELILKAATDGFCILDINGTILEVNASFAAITGYPQVKLLTMNLDDLEITLGERPLVEYLAVVQQPDNLRFQAHCKRQDGVIIDLAASITLIDMGEKSAIFLSAADITTQKAANTQIQESQQLLQLILDLIPTRVFWKDINLRYVGFNRQWAKDTGFSDEFLLGKTDYDIGWSQAERYQANDRRVIQTGEPYYNIEEPQDRPDGSIGWLRTHKIPLHDDEGTVVGILGTYEDITQQKKDKDLLRASEARLQAIFDYSAAGIVLIDTEGRYLQVNDSWCDLLGYSSAELLTMTFIEVTYEEDQRASWDNINALLRREISAYAQEKRYVRKDGRIIWAQLTVSGLPDATGEITALIAIINDITERKSMEASLLQSETRYRALFENMPVALWEEDFSNVRRLIDDLRDQGVTDLRLYFADNPAAMAHCVSQIQVIDVNRKALELYQIPNKEEIVGPLSRTLAENVYPDILDEVLALASGRVRFSKEFQTHTRHGVALEISLNLSVAPGHEKTWGRVFTSLTDITILKQTEAAEHEQRALAEALRDAIAALASSLDADEVQNRILENIGRVVPHEAANIGLIEDNVVRIYKARGYDAGINNFLEHFAMPLDTPNYQKMIESGEPCLVPYIEQNANWVNWSELNWLKSYVSAPIKTHDEVIGFLNLDSNTPGFFTDEHAERLQAFADQVAIALENAQLYAEIRHYAEGLEQRVADRTAELEHERAQLQAILEGVGDGVVYTEGWSVRYFNQQLLTLTGYTSDEIIGDLAGIIQRALPSEFNISNYFEDSRDKPVAGYIWRGTTPVKHADGSTFEASLSMTLLSEPDVTPITVVTLIRDISQEKALQDQKDQFIANASHELRTPLTNIKMRLYLLNKQPSKAADHLHVLELATTQMEELVENLLDLSRFERGAIILQRKEVVLQTLLANVTILQQPAIEQKRLVLRQEVPAEPVSITADGGRMTQVFTNLVANAINYTEEGGTIMLRLEPHEQHVLIQVTDTGMGIAADALDQIFEPFFRVNERYTPGTGLGLPISREIVMLHGGELTVTSQEGQGSTFTVKLPRTPDE